MKINLISDIHALVNGKTMEVIYNLPYLHSKSKYSSTIKRLLDYWKSNFDELSKTAIKKDDIYNAFPECFVVSTHDGIVKYLEAFEACLNDDFADLTVDKAFDFSRAFTIIDNHIRRNSIIWNNKKTKITIQQLVDYMFKHVFDFDPSKLEAADYLVIAGDIGTDNTYDIILSDIEKKTAGKFKKILHVAGNHDHWWIGIKGMNIKRPDTVNLAHDYCLHEDGDYLFVGCTLWTPIPDYAVWKIGRTMNDYIYTPGKFSPYASRHQYEIQSAWLRDKIETNKDKKVIVFTHHQPFDELIADDYKHNGNGWSGDAINEAYVVTDHSLDDINKNGNIKLWCCGHTHKNFDDTIHNIHVVRNPIGYRDTYGYLPAENATKTWYNKIIEV